MEDFDSSRVMSIDSSSNATITSSCAAHTAACRRNCPNLAMRDLPDSPFGAHQHRQEYSNHTHLPLHAWSKLIRTKLHLQMLHAEQQGKYRINLHHSGKVVVCVRQLVEGNTNEPNFTVGVQSLVLEANKRVENRCSWLSRVHCPISRKFGVLEFYGNISKLYISSTTIVRIA